MRSILVLIVVFVAALAQAQTSPENTRIPPGEIIDAVGAHWMLNNGLLDAPNSLDIDQMVYCGQVVYGHRITDNQWYRGTVGAGWILVGPADPCN